MGGLPCLSAGGVPLLDQRRGTQAVADGEAKQVEGPIRYWRVTRWHRKRKSTGVYLYNHYEHFSVGGIDFDIDRDALEAGFANRGSTEEKSTVRLANGMPADRKSVV